MCIILQVSTKCIVLCCILNHIRIGRIKEKKKKKHSIFNSYLIPANQYRIKQPSILDPQKHSLNEITRVFYFFSSTEKKNDNKIIIK